MKNVIAIAAGISDALGFGLNTRAGPDHPGLVEMTRLGNARSGRGERRFPDWPGWGT